MEKTHTTEEYVERLIEIDRKNSVINAHQETIERCAAVWRELDGMIGYKFAAGKLKEALEGKK